MRWLGMFKRHPLVCIAFLLMACEGIGVYFLLPRASVADETEAEAGSEESRLVEFPLGDYQVRNFQSPAAEVILKFSVCLLLKPDMKTKLEQSYESHEQKVRESVSIVARKASREVLAEPGLPTLKRRLKVAIAGAMRSEDEEFEGVLLPDFLVQRG